MSALEKSILPCIGCTIPSKPRTASNIFCCGNCQIIIVVGVGVGVGIGVFGFGFVFVFVFVIIIII